MTNRKKFIYNGILLTAVGLAIKTVNLFFGAFISREIGAEALGLYTLIGTVYSFAITFATSGINLTVTRLVASSVGEGKADEIPRIMRNSVIYSLIFSGASSLVLFFGSEYFALTVLKEARAAVPLRILSASLIPISLSAVISGYFIGVRRIVRNSAVQVGAQVFKIFLTVFFVLKTAPYGVEYAVSALCISTSLTELIAFAIAFLQYIFEPKREKKPDYTSRFSDVTDMALPLAFSTYIRSALLTVEHVLIPLCLRKKLNSESEALASYGLLHGMALPAVLYPMSPLSSFSGLLVPEFAEELARGGSERLKRIAEKVISTTLIYSIPTSVFIYLFSEEIGYVMYSSYDAGFYIAVLAPVLPIMYLDHVTDAMLKGIGEQVYSMWVNISDSLLSVVLVWFLISRLGIAGYAVVIIVMEAYNFILSLIRLKKRIKFRINVFRSLVFPLLAALFSAIASDKIFDISGRLTTPLWLVLKIVFAVSLYLALYLFSNLVFNGKKRETKEKCKNKRGKSLKNAKI